MLSRTKTRLQKYFPVDSTIFFLQFIRHPIAIGALAPSSAHLAEAMTRFVTPSNNHAPGKRFLESGAGTGAFTQAIIDKLSPNDTLDIIEINPKFCERLQKKYTGMNNVAIHTGSILDWEPPYKYDAIVSSLPFNAFKAKFVEEIFKHYRKISKEGGYLSYCEYMALPRIRQVFLPARARKSLQETLDTTAKFEDRYQVKIDKVYANFPPACVHHCQM